MINFEKIEFKDWEIYHSKTPMYNTKQLEELEAKVKTQTLPDIVYGDNRLLLVNKKKDFLYEFSPIDSLNLSGYELQEQMLWKEEEKDQINSIDIIPGNIEVQQAAEWKKKDVSKIEDFTELKPISDWTYSTPYKGTILKLSEHV